MVKHLHSLGKYLKELELLCCWWKCHLVEVKCLGVPTKAKHIYNLWHSVSTSEYIPNRNECHVHQETHARTCQLYLYVPETFEKQPSSRVSKSIQSILCKMHKIILHKSLFFKRTTETYNNMDESHRMILSERYKGPFHLYNSMYKKFKNRLK